MAQSFVLIAAHPFCACTRCINAQQYTRYIEERNWARQSRSLSSETWALCLFSTLESKTKEENSLGLLKKPTINSSMFHQLQTSSLAIPVAADVAFTGSHFWSLFTGVEQPAISIQVTCCKKGKEVYIFLLGSHARFMIMCLSINR